MKTLPRQQKNEKTKKTQSLIAFCAKQNNKNYYLSRQITKLKFKNHIKKERKPE